MVERTVTFDTGDEIIFRGPVPSEETLRMVRDSFAALPQELRDRADLDRYTLVVVTEPNKAFSKETSPTRLQWHQGEGLWVGADDGKSTFAPEAEYAIYLRTHRQGVWAPKKGGGQRYINATPLTAEQFRHNLVHELGHAIFPPEVVWSARNNGYDAPDWGSFGPRPSSMADISRETNPWWYASLQRNEWELIPEVFAYTVLGKTQHLDAVD
ncbi:MAG: hypothetical protein R3324_09500, partial [Halobacteriales archaeon]|nr:hypothetical protein [Halobacteriales archaeon]